MKLFQYAKSIRLLPSKQSDQTAIFKAFLKGQKRSSDTLGFHSITLEAILQYHYLDSDHLQGTFLTLSVMRPWNS